MHRRGLSLSFFLPQTLVWRCSHFLLNTPHLEVLHLTHCYFTNQYQLLHEYQKSTNLARTYRKTLKTLKIQEIYVQGNREQLFDLMMLSTHASHSMLAEHLTVVRQSQPTRDTVLPCELQCPLEMKAWDNLPAPTAGNPIIWFFSEGR